MPRPCHYCPNEIPDGITVDACKACWYDGRALATNMRSVLSTLEAATGWVWDAEHTAGGCFWLSGRPHGMRDGWEADPYLALTSIDDVLAGDSTIAGVEAEGGWCLGFYHPDSDEGVTIDCSTEELPMRAREAVDAWNARHNPQEEA